MSFHDYFFTAPGAIGGRGRSWASTTTRRCSPTRRYAGRSATSLIFLVINVPLTVVLSLVLATALNAAIPFRTFFRVSYYVPYVTASVAVVGVWLFLFNSDGLVNSVLGAARAGPVVAGQRARWRCRRSRSS